MALREIESSAGNARGIAADEWRIQSGNRMRQSMTRGEFVRLVYAPGGFCCGERVVRSRRARSDAPLYLSLQNLFIRSRRVVPQFAF